MFLNSHGTDARFNDILCGQLSKATRDLFTNERLTITRNVIRSRNPCNVVQEAVFYSENWISINDFSTYKPGDSRSCGRLLVSISCTPGWSHSAIISCLWAMRMDDGSFSELINVWERRWLGPVSVSELASKGLPFTRSSSFHPCPARTVMSLESELSGASIFRRFISMKKSGERYSRIFRSTRRADFGETSVGVAGYASPDSYSSFSASRMVFIVLILTFLILSSSGDCNDNVPNDIELYNNLPNRPFTFEMLRGKGELKIFSLG